MDKLCTSHPDVPAQWECRHCRTAWCAGCIETSTIQSYEISDSQKARYYCPTCSRPLRKIAVSCSPIASCWAVLPTLAMLSFHPQPLLFIAPISIIAGFLASLGISPLVLVFLWGGMLPLALSALEQTAQGKLVPPHVTGGIQNLFRYGLKHFCFFSVLSLFLAGDGVSIPIKMACMAFAAAVVPLCIIVLFLSERANEALRPQLLALTARQLGRSYICIMFLFISFLIIAFGTSTILRDLVSAAIARLFQITALNYFTLVAYQLIGYSIYQRSQLLATIPSFKEYFFREGQLAADLTRNQVLEVVDQLIAEDRMDDAITYVDTKAGSALFDLELSQRYYDLLTLHHNVAKQLEHAKVYLDLLAVKGKAQELCNVFLTCKKEDPSFSPSPTTFFTIGRLLNKAGDFRAAAEAFGQFVAAYRHSTKIGRAHV